MNEVNFKEEIQEPLISIVIRTYFREKPLTKTLASISKLNYPKNKLEIIVVKDLKDQSAESVTNLFKGNHPDIKIRLLNISANSATGAWNLGIKHSHGEIVGVTADDVLIQPESIRRALILLRSDCKVAAVTFPTMFETHSISVVVHHMRFIGTLTKNISTVMLLTFYRKKILEEVGFYREDMGLPFTIHEDWELGSRIRKHGYQIIVDGSVAQRHLDALRKNNLKNEFGKLQTISIIANVKQGFTSI